MIWIQTEDSMKEFSDKERIYWGLEKLEYLWKNLNKLEGDERRVMEMIKGLKTKPYKAEWGKSPPEGAEMG